MPRGDIAFGVLTLRNLSSAPIRLSGDITTSNPAFVCESLNNAEIPAESSLQVRVRFVPTVLETISAALTVRLLKPLGLLRFECDETLAEDVVQEAMVKVWLRCASFRGAGDPIAWIHQIVRNTLLDALEKRRPQQPLLDDNGELTLEVQSIVTQLSEAIIPRPEQQLADLKIGLGLT